MLTGRPRRATAALTLDAVNEAGRLQHRLKDVAHRLGEIAARTRDRRRDASVRDDLGLIERTAQNPSPHLRNEVAIVVVNEPSTFRESS